MPPISAKSLLSSTLRRFLKATIGLRESGRRLYAHAWLAAQLTPALPSSVVVLGRSTVYGTGAITFGEHNLLYPDLHLETQDDAAITIGNGVVLSRGVHLVAWSGIFIGTGSMIGEYTSIRDANHQRSADRPIRDSGHSARPVIVGDEVWIGRGVTVLGGRNHWRWCDDRGKCCSYQGCASRLCGRRCTCGTYSAPRYFIAIYQHNDTLATKLAPIVLFSLPQLN